MKPVSLKFESGLITGGFLGNSLEDQLLEGLSSNTKHNTSIKFHKRDLSQQVSLTSSKQKFDDDSPPPHLKDKIL